MAATGMFCCKNCKTPFSARIADRNRGWAKFCSKSCKAVKQTQKTGYAGPKYSDDLDYDVPEGWDGHKEWTNFK